jgi:hypothetical protein
MKVSLTVYYTDGSSGITEFEKPPGHHPTSLGVMAEGLLEAEKGGKKVLKIGTSKVNPFSKPGSSLVINDNLQTREQLLELLKKMMIPLPEKYLPLYR